MTNGNGENIGDRIERKLNISLALNAVLAFVLIVGFIYFGNKASQAHDALCNIRTGQVQSLTSAQDFLAKHPNGAFGFKRADINRQITAAERNLAALDSLGCPAVSVKDLHATP